MVELLMHDIHIIADSNKSLKKQVFLCLRKIFLHSNYHFPTKRSPMQLQLIVLEKNIPILIKKLNCCNANITSKDGSHPPIACEMEPGLSHDCDAVMRNLHGRLKVLGCFRAYGLNCFVFSKFICIMRTISLLVNIILTDIVSSYYIAL
ncbi:unnamed protein product [Musa acuminata var. zebrina]